MTTHSTQPVTLLYQEQPPASLQAEASGDNLWFSFADLTRATGWEIKPEGVCRAEVCIPLPQGRESQYLRQGRFNLAAFARLVEQPIAVDQAHQVWSFGPPAWEWRSRVGTSVAPDFALPDFQGKIHRLSDYRGRKVFLLCWASW
jgi:hypothetical protein